jgi:drug/metabolite transporter (DMT)-like permease
MSTRVPTRFSGIAFALATMLTSGIAVFVNAYGVGRAPDGTTYTTAKNLVAALVLLAVAAGASATGSRAAPRVPARPREWAMLGGVAVVGGGVAFALFFEGLARLSAARTGDPLQATQAQSLHKLVLLLGVAALATLALREWLRWWHAAVVGLLLAGQAQLAGGLSHVGVGTGEALVVAAALLWAAEAVTVRRLVRSVPPLTVAVARMAGGVVVLLAWLAVEGRLARLAWDPAWWGWAIATGAILAVYVGLWTAALARLGALDVTAVLGGAVAVTAVLDRVAAHPVPQHTAGLALSALGAAAALLGAAVVARNGVRRVEVPG